VARLIETLPEWPQDPNRPADMLKVDADEEGVGGNDAADCLRYQVATKAVAVLHQKLRGCRENRKCDRLKAKVRFNTHIKRCCEAQPNASHPPPDCRPSALNPSWKVTVPRRAIPSNGSARKTSGATPSRTSSGRLSNPNFL